MFLNREIEIKVLDEIFLKKTNQLPLIQEGQLWFYTLKDLYRQLAFSESNPEKS